MERFDRLSSPSFTSALFTKKSYPTWKAKNILVTEKNPFQWINIVKAEQNTKNYEIAWSFALKCDFYRYFSAGRIIEL